MTDTPWYLQEFKKSLTANGTLVPVVHQLLIEKRLKSTRDTEHLHPSEICKKDWCPRSSWYTIKGYEKNDESFTFQRLNVFEEGHLIHRKWQDWLTEAGVMVKAELPISDDDHLLLGHADGHVNINGKDMLIEIKSLGVGTFRFENYDLYKECNGNGDEMWKKLRTPFPSHVRQAMLYMHATGIHDLVFLYEWKATQEVKEFTVKFMPELVEPILSACVMVKKCVASGIPPMRPAWIEDEKNKTCKQCPYSKTCWRDYGTRDETSDQFTPEVNDGEVQRELQPPQPSDSGDAGDSGEPRRVIRR